MQLMFLITALYAQALTKDFYKIVAEIHFYKNFCS